MTIDRTGKKSLNSTVDEIGDVDILISIDVHIRRRVQLRIQRTRSARGTGHDRPSRVECSRLTRGIRW